MLIFVQQLKKVHIERRQSRSVGPVEQIIHNIYLCWPNHRSCSEASVIRSIALTGCASRRRRICWSWSWVCGVTLSTECLQQSIHIGRMQTKMSTMSRFPYNVTLWIGWSPTNCSILATSIWSKTLPELVYSLLQDNISTRHTNLL